MGRVKEKTDSAGVDLKSFIIEGKTIIADRKIRVYKKKEDVIIGVPLKEADIA